mgnify:FL=1|jgi:hypothetical protein|tara:strand:- start:1005 stop:1370 length:366 start_codon:yes stop_codon:yes gene_type:complete
MHTKRFGVVTAMPNNTDAGYGPDYSSDPKGPGFVAWLSSGHSPPIYFIRCEDVQEAWDHAVAVLCEIDQETTDYANDLFSRGESGADAWELIDVAAYAAGSSACDDGTIRYTETLVIVELS